MSDKPVFQWWNPGFVLGYLIGLPFMPIIIIYYFIKARRNNGHRENH